MQGESIELSATLYRGFGVALNFSGAQLSDISPSSFDLTMLTTTVTPRYTWSLELRGDPQQRIDVFGQALVGVANGLHSAFPTSSGTQSDANSFALQVGGGVDVVLTKGLTVRPLQVDWIRTELPNGSTNLQNSLRLSAGIVFRFPL
jgi:hypothetical protein